MLKPVSLLWIREDLVQAMFADGSLWAPRETGGLLVGYWSEDETEVVITDIVDAGPKARHGRFTFSPDYEYQQEQLDIILDNGARPLFYIGDWHTHPKGQLTLSLLDHYALWRISRNPEAFAPWPIMLIFAGSEKWDIRAWCKVSSNKNIAQMFPTIQIVPWRAYGSRAG